MLELAGLALFGLVVWILGRTLLGVVFYLVIYSLVSRAAFLLLGEAVNLNGPVTFWVSRGVFLFLTLWLGGRLRAWLGRIPGLVLLVVLLFLYFMVQLVLRPPHIYYYQPGTLM